MNEVEKGRLTVYIKDNNNDEITKVIRHFNTMVKEIENLMNDIKEKESQKREAELKALQAQINPHFLSNILNTAKLLANAQKADNVESLLTSLIQLLHVSMGKENDLITVRREIEYLKDYLNIQEFRFYNKFQVFFEIEEEILEYKLPKFLLQPILENAIIHGVGPKKGQGIIQIKGFVYDGKIIFTITDNGVGMDRETIDRLLREDKAHEGRGFCGIGLRNVQERIQLYFGPEYGLSIDSSPSYFTTVEITLPILQPKSGLKLGCG
jgi:two-component system sensor histidine kinase YesM